ncbi:hypothetical protein QVD17_26128 [Tagetes erecta]|uniref:Dienelactone hydrolase domain-containing protein n=1 Tax=Tagetes erecta TaxID=13708 RepID=A0AAD8K8S5_TARER|nr:hypothetical protein QVD17_26128 [Tagetes erecta]
MLGPDCCRNPPTVSSREESGEVLQIGSLNSYVSGNLDSKIALLFGSDAFGYGAPKLRLATLTAKGVCDVWLLLDMLRDKRQLADKVASAGYYVVVPDFFHGDPLTSFNDIENWLKNHSPEQAVEFAKPVIQALKEKGITKIGAAGFCWGGGCRASKDAEIQVAAILHPSSVTLDDIKEVKVPLAILSAEFDTQNPPQNIKEYEAALVANKVDHFVKIYPGVTHGWTTRYNDDDPAEVKSAEEAQQDLVNWFGKCF